MKIKKVHQLEILKYSLKWSIIGLIMLVLIFI